MSSDKDRRIESSVKSSALSGIILALAALIGVEAAMPVAFPSRRIAIESVRSIGPGGSSLYDFGGIVAIAGASVLVMAWMHRESLRSPILARRPVGFRPIKSQVRSHVERRAAAISYQSGGLYGP